MTDTTESQPSQPRPRKGKLFFAVIAATLLGGVLWALNNWSMPTLAHGPMVQLVRPDGFTVVWEASPHRPGVLMVTDGDAVFKIQAEHTGVQYQASIDTLPAGAEVRYTLVHRTLLGRNVTLDSSRTKTAKNAGQPFRFLVFGDSGSGSPDQFALADFMVEQKPDLVLHVGDLVYQGGHPRDYPATFYRPYAELIRSTPLYPVLGNHDVITENGKPMLERFVLPENGPEHLEMERCFSFVYADALFVGIDTTLPEEQLAETVAPWLDRRLADTDAAWKFVYLHHPPYTNGKHAPNRKVQRSLVGVMEKGGVDVVFAGHNHLYERTARIHQGAVSPEKGIYYVVTGAGGMSKYREEENRPDYILTFTDHLFSFTVIDIDGNRFRLRQIDDRNRVLDEWAFEKPLSTSGNRNIPPDHEDLTQETGRL